MKDTKKYLRNFYIPALLFLIAFVWKVFNIGIRDICVDEPFTIFNAQLSFKDILLLPSHNEPNPPLFMVIMHFWIKLFGISPYAVRIVPILFNSLTTVYIYLLGKKIVNYWGGIIAAGLFIFSSYQFYFGMETRTYSLLLCATAAALYYLFSINYKPGNKLFLIGLAISNFVLVYSHYFGWFVVFMEFVTVLFYLKNRPIIKQSFIAIGTTFVAFAPMIPTVVKQFFTSKEQTWVTPPAKTAYWHEIVSFLNAPVVVYAAFGIFILGLLVFVLSKGKKGFPKELVLLFVFWILPYSIMFFVSAKIPMFENRYVMYNSIGLYLFIGSAIAYLFHHDRWQFLTPIAAVLLLILMALNMHTEREFIANWEVKNTVHYVKNHTNTDYLKIVYPHWNDYEFAYYYDQKIFKDVDNFETHLRDSLIYQVWGLDDAKMYIDKFNDKKIAYLRGGRGEDKIKLYLDSIYNRIDSVFFPDCYFIYLYDNQPNNTEISNL